MSHYKLLSSLSSKRGELVSKIDNEMHNNALANNSDRESRKDYFFSLVDKNKELSKNEKEYCKQRFIYDFELRNAMNKEGKPKECNKCKLKKYSDRFCEGCISLKLQSLFTTWTSGNNIVDNFIQQCQKKSSLPNYILEWIPFEQFDDITKLTEGGFSSIYTATWTRGRIVDYDENKKEFSYLGGGYKVVLKNLNDSSNPGKPFFDEAMNYCKIKAPLIVQCYGITKFPDNGNYAIVLPYVPEGNLRDYLQKNHLNLTLKDRITIFYHLCCALYPIHEKDLIHSDLHSGNILMQGGHCYITDLGLCGPVDEKSSVKVYGIVPYIAPEVLRGKKNTKESDIYSVGMLMWEIFADHPPFDNRSHNHRLIFDICAKGLQPSILPGMPEDFAQMMQRCWDVEPSKRPTSEELVIFAYYKNNEIINDNNSNNTTSSGGSSGSRQVHESHPDAYHKSRILDKLLNQRSLKILYK